MPKSGSGWYFNLINDLLIEMGFDDVRKLKKIYGLDDVLQYYNCNIGLLDENNISHLFPLLNNGHTFTVKTHTGPGDYLSQISDHYKIKTTYIFRDPRAVALSAFDHGKKLRENGQSGFFSGIRTFEESILFAQYQIQAWREWEGFPGTFLIKYEHLLEDPGKVLGQLAENIDVEAETGQIDRILDANQPGRKEGSHFNVGDARRFQKVWSGEQLLYANNKLGEMIVQMGYEI